MNYPKNNRILSSLPENNYQSLSRYLEPVQLYLNEVLLEANQEIQSLYFPTQGVVSSISVMQDGSTTEIALIGKEGMVGTIQFLGNGVLNNRTVVQANGTAMRIDAELLRMECARNSVLQTTLLHYGLKLFNQVSQCAACNNHHTVRQRTARWLLMLDDRYDGKTLSMTQQLLSKMLGVRRTGITEVAKEIQRQGVIEYHRGKIKILDRKALEIIACECYQVLKY